MRKIIRKRSADICPSGFVWVAYFGSKTSSQGFKVVFPAGMKISEVEQHSEAMGFNQREDLKGIFILEVSI